MESCVGVVLGVFGLVSAIDVKKTLQAFVDRVAELVIFVNEHSISMLFIFYRKVGFLKTATPTPSIAGLGFEVDLRTAAVAPHVHERFDVRVIGKPQLPQALLAGARA